MAKKKPIIIDDSELEINNFKSTKDLEEFILNEYHRYQKSMNQQMDDQRNTLQLFKDIARQHKERKETPPTSIVEAITSLSSKLCGLQTNYINFLQRIDKQKNITKSLDEQSENKFNITVTGFNADSVKTTETTVPQDIVDKLHEINAV